MRVIPKLIVLFFVCSCTGNKKEKNDANHLDSTVVIEKKHSSENFDYFLKKFSTDSQFRISRVKFPLKGFNSDETNVNSKDATYLWEKEDWLFYTEEDFNSKSEDIKKTNTVKTDTSMIYRIYKENSGYDIQYNFKQSNEKWFLIYYSYKNF